MNLLRTIFLTALLCCLTSLLWAAKVDTVSTYSESMKKSIKAVVITPDTYSNSREFPVVYLLHGYSGDYANWIKKVPGLSQAVDTQQLIIVCPDGDYASWYFDSPVDSTSRYETYVARELVNWVDGHYKTIRNRSGRAITGLSMGGHGALYLAFRHQETFGAAGSMSGGVDIRPFPNNWEISKRLGTYAKQPENWERNTVINMLYMLTPNALALIIDCGTSDFFYRANTNLHEQLLERNIAHSFISRPGAHDWNYWSTAITYQLLFMRHFFEQPTIKKS
jgi:S-formylglutathione hydrolase FrmB